MYIQQACFPLHDRGSKRFGVFEPPRTHEKLLNRLSKSVVRATFKGVEPPRTDVKLSCRIGSLSQIVVWTSSKVLNHPELMRNYPLVSKTIVGLIDQLRLLRNYNTEITKCTGFTFPGQLDLVPGAYRVLIMKLSQFEQMILWMKYRTSQTLFFLAILQNLLPAKSVMGNCISEEHEENGSWSSSQESEVDRSHPPKFTDKYEVIGKVGRGNFGHVYKAQASCHCKSKQKPRLGVPGIKLESNIMTACNRSTSWLLFYSTLCYLSFDLVVSVYQPQPLPRGWCRADHGQTCKETPPGYLAPWLFVRHSCGGDWVVANSSG